ncbi:carboxypeptidase regulatory-like domain-containing protein [Archangium violaceum]|uniref:carboxypeptidase regulatory-like domain-containing protein n=1 Tax=Archangium violaceum TaxID=83451 RepID=UPI001363F4C7|nr:carboxypeptidase regulatory-like domain-containing protein [Archangium violaceum]
MKRLGLVVLGLVVLGAILLTLRGLNAPAGDEPADGKSASPERKSRVMVRSQNVASRGLGLSEANTLPIVPDKDPEGSLRLQVLVLDPQELPVADATVLLDSNPVRSAHTEKDGTFTFTGLTPRAYQLEARHGSLQAGPLSLWLSERSEPLVLHLRPAASLEVEVVEAGSRRAVPGAIVEARTQQPRSATTDGSGRALLQALPTGRLVLKVSARGFSPVWQQLSVGQASSVPQRVTVAVRSGAAVSGTVVDASGAPVSGVTVTPVPSTQSLQTLTDARWDGTVTDASGRWRFEQLTAGSYRFEASSPQRATGSSAPVTLEEDRETSGITITLPEPTRLMGQVLDDRGEPVPHALVRVALDEGMSRTLARQVTCDQRGEFVMEGLPQRRLALLALHEQASSTTRYVDLSQEPVRQEKVLLVLNATEVLRGHVEFSNGQPAGEAVVQAELSSARARGRVEQTLRGQLVTQADPAGRFELRGLQPGTYLLRAAPPGTPPQRTLAWLVPPVQAETGGREAVLRINLGGAIRGQVRRDDNSVPESFSVVLRGSGSIPYGGGDGRFLLQGVPEGSHTLYITGPGFITKAVQDVQVQEGKETDVGVVVLQAGRRLQGQVLRANGTPVADAMVSISQALKGSGVVVGTAAELDYGLQQARTGADGRFTFAGLPITPLQLMGEHPQEGRSEFVQIPAGVAALERNLRLAATGQLEGTVLSGGQPMSGALVMVTNPSAPAGGTTGTTGTDGRFRFDNLAPGTYMVLAVADSAGSQQVQRTTTTLQAQQVARVELEFPQGDVTVFVRAQPAEGASATSARVLLMAKAQPGTTAPPAQVQVLTPVEPARFTAVIPGDYNLCVSPMTEVPPTDGGTTAPRSKCNPFTVSQQPSLQEVMVAMPHL